MNYLMIVNLFEYDVIFCNLVDWVLSGCCELRSTHCFRLLRYRKLELSDCLCEYTALGVLSSSEVFTRFIYAGSFISRFFLH